MNLIGTSRFPNVPYATVSFTSRKYNPTNTAKMIRNAPAPRVRGILLGKSLHLPIDPSTQFLLNASSPYKRIYTSKHGSLHSRAPSQLRTHSRPTPVHSGVTSIRRLNSSIAAPARALAVWLIAEARKDASPELKPPTPAEYSSD
jgi:hypothetical protein